MPERLAADAEGAARGGVLQGVFQQGHQGRAHLQLVNRDQAVGGVAAQRQLHAAQPQQRGNDVELGLQQRLDGADLVGPGARFDKGEHAHDEGVELTELVHQAAGDQGPVDAVVHLVGQHAGIQRGGAQGGAQLMCEFGGESAHGGQAGLAFQGVALAAGGGDVFQAHPLGVQVGRVQPIDLDHAGFGASAGGVAVAGALALPVGRQCKRLPLAQMGHEAGGGGVETEHPGLAQGDQTKRHLGHQGFGALFRAQAALLFVGVAGLGVGQVAAQLVHHMAQRDVAVWRGLARGLRRVFHGAKRGRKLEHRRGQGGAFVGSQC